MFLTILLQKTRSYELLVGFGQVQA